MKKKKLYLLDLMPLLYRAHFATMSKRLATGTGVDTRTTLVFFNYIFQILAEEKPDAMAAVVDSRPVQRLSMYSAYKENRDKMPDAVSDSLPFAMRLMEALKIPVYKEEGHEADDVIASLAMLGIANNYQIYIVSPDKDFAQLVNGNILLMRPAYKGQSLELLDAEGVKKKYGVEPVQIADYLALKGDAIDNIPGVKGIGDKTAAILLSQFDSVETLLGSLDQIKQDKIKTSLKESAQQLKQSKKLATLDTDLRINVNPPDLKIKKADDEKLFSLLDELEFVKIKERVIKLGIGVKQSEEEEKNVTSMNVQDADVNAIVEILKRQQQISLAYRKEFPESVFIYCEDKIYKTSPASSSEWKSLLNEIDTVNVQKITWENKHLLKRMELLNVKPESVWMDLQLAAYLLDPDSRIEWAAIERKYKLQRHEITAPYSSLSFLPSLQQAYSVMQDSLEKLQLTELLLKIELPLSRVLARMELTGINIDLNSLKEIENVLTQQLNELEHLLYALAGRKLNVNSPAQVAEVLKEIAAPAELKRTPTGQVSTAEPFLAELAPKYPFVDALLKHRKLNKVITTYVLALPKFVNEKTGKIHPSFQQAVTGTGRLSCTDPNLQNLPVKYESGREVRKSVIASGTDYRIVAIDYNQVELRLLAALSGDEVMIGAFRAGKDIHTITASKVFGMEESQVTKEYRNKAKGINFGIAYGITPWGLATRLKISQTEAKRIIDAYFDEFPSVRSYLEKSIESTRARGYSRTAYGRIRYIDGINSRNITTRKMAERMAVNAPLQGLAADIIKDAMVELDAYTEKNKLKTKMVLQVHDELVFDTHIDELADFVPVAKKIMESRGDFPVDLTVEVSVGKNWLELIPVKNFTHIEI